jgi:[histone H3]-lysine36 N-trimethyltransferase
MLEPIREEVTEDRPPKRSKTEDEAPKLNIRPLGMTAARTHLPVSTTSVIQVQAPDVTTTHKQASREAIAAIIAAAARTATEIPSIPSKLDQKTGDKKSSSSGRRDRGERKKQSKEEKEANKEKKLKKLVGAIVVKTMSKYQKHMDHDTFKKYAKEVLRHLSCPVLVLIVHCTLS